MIYSFKLIHCNGEEKAGLVIANNYTEATKKVVDFFQETDIEYFTSLKYVSENEIILIPSEQSNELFQTIEDANF